MLSLEALMLWSTIIEVHKDKLMFNSVMSYILATVYGLTIIIYIPLYSTVMERLRVAFPDVHMQLYRKVNIGFVCVMILLGIRYAIYLSL